MKPTYNPKMLASLALFRQLYNEGKSDVLSILCEFVKTIICSRSLKVFNVTEIKQYLETDYDFNIPEAVVESVLRKFCKKENGFYTYDHIDSQFDANEECEKLNSDNQSIIKALVQFVELKTSKELRQTEIADLTQAFCQYLVEDDTNVDYAQYISAFIVTNQNDEQFSQQLKTIKEGVILYTGIKYNDNVSDVGSWKSDFVIYLEQEILFHCAGFNGILYQQLFEDLINLVNEANQKAKKKLIAIKYFDEVKKEIENFFFVAEKIAEGKETLDCSNQAMVAITNGCESKADVITKKVEFYDMLRSKSIHEEDAIDYNLEKNQKYNIESNELVVKLESEMPTKSFYDNLKLLNYVNITRKCYPTNLERSKCILLTGDSVTMSLAFHPDIKKNGNVPLATTLDFMTNRLWFKMNKGFGNTAQYPKSFDFVTKAQIVLSSQMSGSISKEFDKIKNEIESKGKSQDVIIAELAEFKERSKLPEEITPDNIDEVLDVISMQDTEKYIREKETIRKEAESQRKENLKLQCEIERKNKENSVLMYEKDCKIKDKEDENKRLAEQLRLSKSNEKNRIQDQINAILKRKSKADLKIERRIKKVRWVPWGLIILVITVIVLLTYKYGWDKMEFWTWLLSAIIASIPYLVFGLGFKAWNPRKVIDVWYKDRLTKRIYSEFDVDLSKLQQLEDDLKRVG